MNMPQGTEINSPASPAELPFTEVVVTRKYKRPRSDLPTPLETRNRYTPLGDPRLKIVRCDDGDSIPRKARRPPPIVIGTQMPVQQLKNLMLANGIRGSNIKTTITSVKVFTETKEEHSMAVKVLDSKNIEFHTYSRK